MWCQCAYPSINYTADIAIYTADNFLTTNNCATNYLTTSYCTTNYLTTSNCTSNYLTTSNCTSNYLTTSNCTTNYLPPVTVPRITLPPATVPRITLPPATFPRYTLPPATIPRTVPPIRFPFGKRSLMAHKTMVNKRALNFEIPHFDTTELESQLDELETQINSAMGGNKIASGNYNNELTYCRTAFFELKVKTFRHLKVQG